MSNAQWFPAVGNALLIPSGPGNKNHLHVIVYGPSGIPHYGTVDQLVFVGMSTIYPEVWHDSSCVVRKGDHPFVSHDSYMYYRKSFISSVPHTMDMIQKGVWIPMDSFSAPLMKRVMSGLKGNESASREVRDVMFPRG